MPVRGPRLKLIRRLGVALPGLTTRTAERRPHPPGMHGAAADRKRRSLYRQRLDEKQKLRINYGVSERQLRRYLADARAAGGPTGANLLALLERRLDNVVFRLGLAPTIPAARQLVGHGHVAVDGRPADRAGRLVRIGETVTLSARGRARPALREQAARGPALRLPGYLTPLADGGRFTGTPERPDVPFPVDEARIVEFYAR